VSVDVDECLVRDVCDHTCTNTNGSYECRCRLGYLLSTGDFKTCKGKNILLQCDFIMTFVNFII